MESEAAPNDLRYLEPTQATIDGVRCEDITIRAATGGVLGRLQGFIVDPVARQLRYFVVRTTGIMGRSRLLPVLGARFDLEHRAIELLTNGVEYLNHRQFNRGRFARFSDEDLLRALFGGRASGRVA
jgi:hypothetical protein